MSVGTLQRIANGSHIDAAEPVGVDEIRRQLNITAGDDDELLYDLAAAAREHFEREVPGTLAFRLQTYRWTFREFPASSTTALHLPRPPCFSSTDVAIGYVDTGGSTQTWASTNYVVHLCDDAPAKILPAFNQSWPSVRAQDDGAQIQFVAGYASTDVPRRAKQAIRMIAADWYEHRENQVEGQLSAPVDLGVARLARALAWGSYA